MLREDFENGSVCFDEQLISFYSAKTIPGGSVKDGVFHLSINSLAGEMYFAPCRQLELDMFEIEVEAKLVKGPGGVGYGIVFLLMPVHNTRARTMVSFLVNDQGEYCIYQHYIENAVTSYANNRLAGCWAKTPGSFKPGQFNTLRVVVDSEAFALYVNDVLAGSVIVPKFTFEFIGSREGFSGIVGLATGLSEKDGETRILLDNLVITR